MGMSDDWERLQQLDRSGSLQQYGTTTPIRPSPANADLVQAASDVVRFQGEKVDINAWRIYLGPWQPSPKVQIATGGGGVILLAADSPTVNYAQPTPWAPPQPRNFDAMVSISAYARVQWGSGGVQHIAFIDWPKRGLLFQVSGSTVQVCAFVNTQSNNLSPDQLPNLSATLAPEPGGGDAVQPATYTYDPDTGDTAPGPPATSTRNFQVPPFARAFVPLVNLSKLVSEGARIDVFVQNQPGDLGEDNEQQSWLTPIVGSYEPSFGRDPFPVSGQQAGNVRIVITGATSPRFGCMFLLDL